MPNTIAKRYYPRLSEVVTLQDLPEFLNFLENGLDQVFDRIHYKNLQYSKSFNGDAAFYSLDLVTRNRLQFPLPGGMQLVMNPDVDGDSGISSFPIAIEYKWEILAFVRAFKMQEFSFSLEDFYKLGLKVFRLTDEQVTANVLNFFVEPADENTSVYQTVLNDVGALTNQTLTFPVGEEESFSLLMQVLQGANLPNSIPMLLFGLYVLDSDLDTTKRNLDAFYKRIVPEGIEAYLKKLITPKIKAGFTLSAGLEFPRNMLKPVYNPDGSNPFNENEPVDPENKLKVIPPDENDEPKFMLSFGEAEFNVDTEKGLGYQMDLTLDSNAYAQVADTGFILYVDNMKLDLSKKNNIEEATLDGRPADFIGAYIEEASISFPAKWNHDDESSTAQLYASKVLIGTGGISGTIGMRAVNMELDPNVVPPLLQVKFGEFKVGLSEFSLTFHQNAIIESTIKGTLEIPGFKNEDESQAVIEIDVHIGQDGEFNVVASTQEVVKKIKVPGAFTFGIDSLFFGREKGDDGRFYVGISGELDFTIDGMIGNYLPDKIDIEKMLIYEDGTFEFEGGKLTLPKAFTLSFGPAKLSISAVHMGGYERNGRKYKFFGFDGGVKVNPGGVEAHGKGIKYYYTVDDEEPFDWFIGLESLSVDIIIPSGADPEKAAVAIRGFLSIAEPKILPGTPEPLLSILKNSQEYSGGVSVSIPKFKGLKGSAAMRLNPKVPSFIIDLGIELSTPIVLGSTGLGIYGFRGILGKKYVATKQAAGVPEDGEWWQYYKAKIDPDNRQGIQISKFSIKNGFSFGAGVSLATASDSGKIFSSKLFFLLSLPDVFLFQGQAQFLKERIGLDANPDPPFFAIIAITSKSIEAGFGINYKLRDDGKIVTVDGIIEMGFFWGNSSAWYINVGRETPEDRRIRARLFDILDMYFYLMLSSGGLRLGAGVKFEKKKNFGPLSAELKAYIDTFGKISRRPKQIGGAIKMGGHVKLAICGFGFGVSGGATLAAEAPKPHIVTGEFEVCVTVLKKERCARFEFTWDFDDEVDTTRVPLLIGTVGDSDSLDTADVNRVGGSMHMVSGERFPIASRILGANEPIPVPGSWITETSDGYRIPMDSFIDIEFKKGINVNPGSGNNLGKIGGQSTPAKFVEFVPPVRGKTDRVRHEYYLNNIEIFYWNEELNNGTGAWEPYDFYEALLPIYENASGTLADAVMEQAVNGVDFPTLNNLKWGYWQQQQPGVNNKLRILATSPLSYASSTGDAFQIEDMGINDGTIFCPGDPIPKTCITFDPEDLYTSYPRNTLRSYENVLFRIVDGDGIVLNVFYGGLNNGLIIPFGCKLEIFFNEPVKIADLLLSSAASQMDVNYYRRETADGSINGLTTYDYELIHTERVVGGYNQGIEYTCADEGGIDHITIEPGDCKLTGLVDVKVTNQNLLLNDIGSFLETLIEETQLTDSSVELFPLYKAAYTDFLSSSLYGLPVSGTVVELVQTHLSATSLSFRIISSNGFDCLYTLTLKSGLAQFDFSNISRVVSVTPYTADDTAGANTNFLVVFELKDRSRVEFIGSTCKPLSYSYDACATGFYKLCYLSLEDYLTNQTIPTEEVQEADNDALIDAINKTLQPVWRPNTTYAIQVKTEDRLFREGGSSGLGTYRERVVYGFRTAGPIGHFHQYPKLQGTTEIVQSRGDYAALANAGKADEFRLNNLRSYIDYSKSYPNADGQLINAKPLFYLNAELRLFYLYNYVYQFYTDWADYSNSTELNVLKVAESSLEVNIVNPAPSQTPEHVISEGFEANSIIRNSVAGMPPDLINEVNNDVSILNNLLINGSPCAPYTPMIPIDISTKKVADLKPSKLYTAQFVAKYRPAFNGELSDQYFRSLVHNYVFQTSRYGSFEEQVKSYILKKAGEEVLREAVYPLELTKNFDGSLAEKVITKNLELQQDALLNQYADRFEQLMNGVFAVDLNTLQAAVTTEFNLVKHNGKLVGILIRNPEPFNDPKIPFAEFSNSSVTPGETLIVSEFTGGSWTNENNYVVVHSKDKSQLFVTMRNFSFDLDPQSKLKFTFKYKQYNGLDYEDSSTVDVELDLTNYTI